MKQEFDLSEKIHYEGEWYLDYISLNDVKEFIKILLNTYEGTDENWIRKETIIKLAGKELK